MRILGTRLQDLYVKFNELLKLNTFPVAVKLFKDEAKLDEIAKARPTTKHTICQLLAQARYMGKVLGAHIEDADACAFGARNMGFVELPEDVLAGKRTLNIYHASEEIAKKAIDSIPKLDLGNKGVLVAPMNQCPIDDPDVVVFYGNSAQMLRLINSYVWKTGERLTFGTVGQCTCADAVVTAIKTGKPALTLPCMGARLLSIVQEWEMMMGVPGHLLEALVEGLENTHKGGVKYPIAYQMIYLTPQPPVSRLIGREVVVK
ncbi:MAG: hypothetical protein DRJ33_02460 [Candidatus Methanomethylicota archaeon]|uniref:DUF169 domain-containing protein n=1 Tax=Thermoproteota archaeon TaxID=2056631 RepID=A0A497F0A3_9CREN|nr:MAG: hypothetical protein DRJ33_02460 [Candidatus Verstraetearchaeota archaeon]